MDKENLPFDLYEEFDFEDFCKYCPHLDFETDFTKTTCIMGEITINLKHTCPHIDKCRRLKHTLDKQK
jgi:hypothetical protein